MNKIKRITKIFTLLIFMILSYFITYKVLGYTYSREGASGYLTNIVNSNSGDIIWANSQYALGWDAYNAFSNIVVRNDAGKRCWLLCAQRGQNLSDYPKATYRVTDKITISGSALTSQSNGKTFKSITAHRLAWIWNNIGYFYYSDGVVHYDTSEDRSAQPRSFNKVQRATWKLLSELQNDLDSQGYQYNGFVFKEADANSSSFDDVDRAVGDAAVRRAQQIITNSNEQISQIKDYTNKQNIKVVSENINGQTLLKIGPFNWETPRISSIQVKGKTSINSNNLINVTNVKFGVYEGNNLKVYNNIENLQNQKTINKDLQLYLLIPSNASVVQINRVEMKSVQYSEYGAEVYLLDGWDERDGRQIQNLMFVDPKPTTTDTTGEFDYNIELIGNLKVIKVDQNNKQITLPGVGFIIQNATTSKYLIKQNGVITEGSKENATTFYTDSKGELQIKGLTVGKYLLYETVNPDEYYTFDSNDPKEVIVNVTDRTEYLGNKQEYVDLSGNVWLDVQSQKQSIRNNLLKEDEADNNDELLDGIIVKLKYIDSKTVVKNKDGIEMSTKTANGGKYLFEKIKVDDLSNYYVEFEYDGLKYTNVTSHVENDEKGSKSAENRDERTNFNKNFGIIEGTTRDTGITKNIDSKQKVYDLKYTLDEEEMTATLNEQYYPMIATTDETTYKIKDHFVAGQKEIKNVNLGLYKREQTDYAIAQDLQSVRLTINGYEHTYIYENRFKNQSEEYIDGQFNVGVKFEAERVNQKYTRPIYKSDYNNTNMPDASKELKAYVTYKVLLKAQTTHLTGQIYDIINYYDNNYKIVSAGTQVDEKTGKTSGDINVPESEKYNDNYNKVILTTNAKISPQEFKEVYIQYEISREKIAEIIDKDEEALANVVEIKSYSTYDNEGNIYASIDKDSNPGVCDPERVETYEDDADHAPRLKLETVNDRTISGVVFEDSAISQGIGQERIGNGIYDEGQEKGIANVEVVMTQVNSAGTILPDSNGNVIEYTATTNENGEFTITGYKPGNYRITYKWGKDFGGYDVKDYKGTICLEPNRFENIGWYKTENPRYSDAMDDYGLRKAIDSGDTSIYGDIAKMLSDTPMFGVGVDAQGSLEVNVATSSDGDIFVRQDSKAVDFGIIERPRQQVDVSKRVSKVRIKDEQGVDIAEARVVQNSDGTFKLEGEITKAITYQGPSDQYEPKTGFIRIQRDPEIIQGATLQLEYIISVKNNSEVDYATEEYYKYGTNKTNIVKIIPEGVYDYLDKELSLDSQNDNSKWEITETISNKTNSVEMTPLEKYAYEYYYSYKTTENKPDGQVLNITGSGYESFEEEYKELIETWSEENVTIGRQRRLQDKTIINSLDLEQELEPNEERVSTLYASKVLGNIEEVYLTNDTEITKVTRTTDTGREVTPIASKLSDGSEVIEITGNEGENQNYLPYIIIGLIATTILGVGIVLIKKKVIK